MGSVGLMFLISPDKDLALLNNEPIKHTIDDYLLQITVFENDNRVSHNRALATLAVFVEAFYFLVIKCKMKRGKEQCSNRKNDSEASRRLYMYNQNRRR